MPCLNRHLGYLYLLAVLAFVPALQADGCDQCLAGETLICPAGGCTIGGDESNPDLVANFGTPRSGWPQASKGDSVYLTYSYQNMFDGGLLDPGGQPVPESQIRTAIEEAFLVWAEVVPVHFREVEDDGLPYGQSSLHGTIRLRHVYINGPDPENGSPIAKAVARFPGTSNYSGDIDFDHSDPWALIGTIHEPDFLGAAIHEIGHTLGLTHSNVPTSNMYWTFKRHTGPGSGALEPDDIAAIQSVYGPGVGSVTPLLAAVPEPQAWVVMLVLLSLAGNLVAGRTN
ncbi:matrixin family metalloprotease [Aeoliella mucimassa]|uniref:Matrixin n=1 Tax=Aeoliella mucimassa TaxID=2527972 RepID=A0A518AKE1_9BACT|nr:matrixin family metalloprotease [Aeoliella mucimassa]QDU55183.1 Matrixin [Aeoliella mucimassa]